MAAIRKELGEDGTEDVVEGYRAKIAGAGMPDDVRTQAERELGRLERTSKQSPEYGCPYLPRLVARRAVVREDG